MDFNQRFSELVDEISSMVETVSTAPALESADVRRTLRFIAQVIQVVEQAFQDVLTLLIEIKYLEPQDLQSDKVRDLRKQVDLLTARSHYRDAAEICSRLKHLRSTFDDGIRQSLVVLPQISGWDGILNLIEDREGRIIMLIESTAWELSGLLGAVTPESLTGLRSVASDNAEALRKLLAELHDLNGRILGYSGRDGLMELTRDRSQLQREVQIMIDKRDQSITHGHRVSLGDGSTIQNLAVATTIQGSFNQVQQASVEQDLKSALEQLCSQVEVMIARLPAERRADVEQDLSSLVTEATKKEPRKKWYDLSASGLIDAAKACAGAASPVIAAVKTVLGHLDGGAAP